MDPYSGYRYINAQLEEIQPMSQSTEWLVRITLVIVLLYAGWSLAAQTVLQLLNLNQQVSVCRSQLQAAQEKK